MAKITIVGDAVVITSERTLEEIKTLKKYKPEALELKDEEGDVYFKVGTECGNANQYGVSFMEESRNGDGKASLTILISPCIEDAVKYVTDRFGLAILNLNKVEKQFDTALEEVSAQQAEILENITVA